MSEPLFHFSDRADIDRFDPHVPASNPTQPPAVWAIDRAHAPAYWFPRDCPRVCWWESDGRDRVHVVEASWAPVLEEVGLHEYTLPWATFEPWPEAEGQYVSRVSVVPDGRRPLPSARALHEAGGVELRIVEDLWPVIDEVVAERSHFSIIRKANLDPRR